MTASAVPAPYLRYVATSAFHTLDMLPRRKISIFAIILAFLPVAIPATLLIPRDMFYDPNGQQVFTRVAQFLYITALAPLFSLFYGSTLIGEDIESNTFPYIFTRPIPRSAWVLGKFAGFWVGVSAILGASMLLSFFISTRLAEFPITFENILFFGKFFGAMTLAIAAYGGLSLFLGAAMKRPVIWGIGLIFFWQRIALMIPGYLDYFTIDKYVSAVMPEVEGLQSVIEMAAQAMGATELLGNVGPLTSIFALLGIAAAFVALAAVITRSREYTSAIATDT